MEKKNILISDANHGGLILLEEYYKYTTNNLFFYDIYDKLSDEEKDDLNKRFNVTFLSLDEIKADEDNFVKINPVHMPPVINTDYTHHEFVAYLLNRNDFDFKIIQVTGVKGKTTVASLISDVLCDYNTLILTSNSLTYNDDVLIEHLSIAPSSIITAINKAKEEKIIDEIDYCIFEVSLGAVPNNYLNVLTNILEDYPIAGNSKSASVAKESVFSSEITLCDLDAFNEFYSSHDAVTLSLDDESADIYASDITYDFNNSEFAVNYFGEKYDFRHFALSDFYVNNLMFAIGTGLLLDMDMRDIISNLNKSHNVRGRHSYEKVNGRTIIEDINPGLNTTSIRKCIENLNKFNEDYYLIIGGDYGITCEEINEEKLTEYLERLNEKNIILAGALGKNLSIQLKQEYKHFDLLNDAVKYLLDKSDIKLIQIIYRSEYTKYDSDLFYLNPS